MICKRKDIAELSLLLNKAAVYDRAPYVAIYIEPRLCGILADVLYNALLDGMIEFKKEEDKDDEETNI